MTAAGFEGHSNALLNQYRASEARLIEQLDLKAIELRAAQNWIAVLEAEIARMRPVVEAAHVWRDAHLNPEFLTVGVIEEERALIRALEAEPKIAPEGR